MELYPAILTDSIIEFNQQLAICQTVPELKTIHVDIIDGQFADNITVAPLGLLQADPGELQYDLHLMTDDPMDYVYEAGGLKAELPIRTVIAQVEHMSFQADFLEEVRKQGWRTGLALDLHTPLEAIDQLSWLDIDVLQLMAVELGQQGRPFQPSILDKITEAQSMIQDTGRTIELLVDGGVKEQHLALLGRAGVSGVAVGSAIWRASEPVQEIQVLLGEAERAGE